MRDAHIDRHGAGKVSHDAYARSGASTVKKEPRRPCRSCDAWLARDNEADVCTPCARRENDARDGTPRLPDGVWERPEITQAIRDRHFGRLLLALRRAHDPELTQTDIGQVLHLTQGQVSRIERSNRPVTDLAKLDRWARALGIPQRHMWFTLTDDSFDEYDAADSGRSLPTFDGTEGDDVHRRRFLQTAGAGVMAIGGSLLRGEPLRAAAADHARTCTESAAEIREMTQAFRRLDNRYGGGHSRSVVTSYISSILGPALKKSRLAGSARNELFSAAAEIHHLAGWMAYDVGQKDAGRRHLRQALRLSQEAGSDALEAEMLAGMSHHAAFLGAPATAVDLAVAAQHAAKRSGIAALLSEVAVMEAHALALQGDKPRCLRALQVAETAYNSGGGDCPTWLAYFDDAYLAAKFAHTFRDLGLPREAEIFARRSLEMSDGYERGRMFNTALLASTLADQGKVDEACALGQRAVEMANTVRSTRSTTYLDDLGGRLQPFAGTPYVRDLYGAMAASGLATPL